MSTNASCVYSIVPVVQNGQHQVTTPCTGDHIWAMAQDDERVFSAPTGKLKELLFGLKCKHDQGYGLGNKVGLAPEYELYGPYAEIGKMLGMGIEK